MSDSARKAAYRLCALAIDNYFQGRPETTADVLVEALHVRDALDTAGQVPSLDTSRVLTIAPAIITNGHNQ